MTRLYLNVTAGGLAFVSLFYALAPHTGLGALVDLPFDNTDQIHVFRGVMGLYLGMVVFWFLSASRPEYSRAAVISVVCFMLGLASGRIISMLIDGMPSDFLAQATLIEIFSGVWGLYILRQGDPVAP